MIERIRLYISIFICIIILSLVLFTFSMIYYSNYGQPECPPYVSALTALNTFKAFIESYKETFGSYPNDIKSLVDHTNKVIFNGKMPLSLKELLLGYKSKNGYSYEIRFPNIGKYEIYAKPENPDKETQYFFVDESGVLRFTEYKARGKITYNGREWKEWK